MQRLWARVRLWALARRRRWLLAALAVLLVLAAVMMLRWPLLPADPGAALWARFGAVRVVDRHGAPLAALTGPEHTRARPVALQAVSPWLVKATLTLEDKRFYSHSGVDALAAARALWGNLRAGRVTSGASTLTQQLVKWLREDPQQRQPRRWGTKLVEAVAALQLEQQASKDQILSWYVNFAPYGGLVRGAEQAAQTWFAKPAAQLTAAEAAVLAVVARSPGRLNPAQHLDRARPAAHALLRRMHAAGQLGEAELQLALDQPVVLAKHGERRTAPHFSAFVAGALHNHLPEQTADVHTVQTTLVAPLQAEVQALVRAHVLRSRPLGVGNAAVVVLDLPSAEVLALVGSADAGEAAALGANNGALALRQPGSTIKPFAYAAGFDAGLDPAVLLADVPATFATATGAWQPGNYGDRYAGPVLARMALASSLNLAAIRWTERLGLDRLRNVLGQLGFASLQRTAEHYGLALVLGDGEVTLLELTAAFAALGREGRYLPPRWLRAALTPAQALRPASAVPVQVFSPRAAWWTTDILADPAARSPAFGRDGALELPFWTAVKTGTSKGFRDNWTVAVTDRYAVGVWVGHFDGRPMPGVSGVTGAAPLARDVLLALHKNQPAVAPQPLAGLQRQPICALSGAAPGPHCHQTRSEWLPDGVARPVCRVHRLVRIDRVTAGLAGPGCPPQTLEERVVVELPSLFASWQDDALPRAPKHASPRCPPLDDAVQAAGPAATGPRIVQPANHAVWLLDSLLRPEEQQVALLAVGEGPLRWDLPGRTQTAASGERVLWTPQPGQHVLRVTDARGRSAAVQVRVQAASSGP